MEVSYIERMQDVPLLYGAKLQMSTGAWEVSVSALLPILVIFDEVSPVSNGANVLINTGKLLLTNINKIKTKVKNREKIVNKDLPFLMSHQAACAEIAACRPRYGLFLDTGTR